MGSARIRVHNPERVPQDLAFTVDEIETVPPEVEFPEPEDPIVVYVDNPRDLIVGRTRIREDQGGHDVLVKVATPSLLGRPEFGELVDEAGSDLFSIDLID